MRLFRSALLYLALSLGANTAAAADIATLDALREGDMATGKNVGDDFRERKLTLPVIKAVARATPQERAFWQRTIEQGKQHDGDLQTAMALMEKHGTIKATRDDAVGWADKARMLLGRVAGTFD